MASVLPTSGLACESKMMGVLYFMSFGVVKNSFRLLRLLFLVESRKLEWTEALIIRQPTKCIGLGTMRKSHSWAGQMGCVELLVVVLGLFCLTNALGPLGQQGAQCARDCC